MLQNTCISVKNMVLLIIVRDGFALGSWSFNQYFIYQNPPTSSSAEGRCIFMTGDKLGRLIYNTGYREELTRKNFVFPPSERISLDWTIKKAKEQNGIVIDNNIVLELSTFNNSCTTERTDVYKAMFSYVSEGKKDVFLLSFGARNSTSCQVVWPMICNEMKDICKQAPPTPYHNLARHWR